MANHKSAKKRIRQNEKRREQNAQYKASVRTAIKRTRSSAEEGNKEDALKFFETAKTMIDKAASHGLYHPKNASRKVSRLAKMVNGLA